MTHTLALMAQATTLEDIIDRRDALIEALKERLSIYEKVDSFALLKRAQEFLPATRVANEDSTDKPLVLVGLVSRWNGQCWEQLENHVGEEGDIEGQPFTMRSREPWLPAANGRIDLHTGELLAEPSPSGADS